MVRCESEFRMSVIPITRRMYALFDDRHEEAWLSEYPVVNVTWYAARAFCSWLSMSVPELHGARLPREIEWEYVRRLDTANMVTNSTNILERAWTAKNSGGHPHPVARLSPGAIGLYDMLGNVNEWCLDSTVPGELERDTCFSADEMSTFLSEDPEEPLRSACGGCYHDPTLLLSENQRVVLPSNVASPLVGFRVLVPGRGSHRQTDIVEGAGTRRNQV